MKRISVKIDESIFMAFEKKSKSLGFSKSTYLKILIRESIAKKQEIDIKQIKGLLEAMIPILCEMVGRTQGVTSEKVEQLSEILKQKYQKELLDEKSTRN